MEETIKLLDKGFVSSSSTTKEFLDFAKTFSREIKKELQSIGATEIKINRGHFYMSGFFTVNNKPFYFSISDVRNMIEMPFVDGYALLYRRVKDYKDFRGEVNKWISIEKGMALKMKLN